jgi:integrase
MTTHIEFIPHPSESFRITGDLTFDEAADRYIRSRTVDALSPATARPTRRNRQFQNGYIRSRTLNSYEQYVRSLGLFFSGRILNSISASDLRRYQAARLAGAAPFIRKRRPHQEPGPCPAGPLKTNQEVDMLVRLLRRAGLWVPPLAEEYEQLQVSPAEMARALTREEEERWLNASLENKDHLLIHWYSLLGFDTCMSTNEIRALRIGDIYLETRVLRIPPDGAKNIHRLRTIPLISPRVEWAVKNLLIRANALGATEPDHYLFPFRRGNGAYYPLRPMTESGLKRQWQEVREKTGLLWFRQYDLRHTAITRLAEADTPLSVIMSMAGHVSEKMREHYTHISTAAKIHALREVQNFRERKPNFQPAPAVKVPPHIAGPNRSDFLTSSLNWTGGGSL